MILFINQSKTIMFRLFPIISQSIRHQFLHIIHHSRNSWQLYHRFSVFRRISHTILFILCYYLQASLGKDLSSISKRMLEKIVKSPTHWGVQSRLGLEKDRLRDARRCGEQWRGRVRRAGELRDPSSTGRASGTGQARVSAAGLGGPANAVTHFVSWDYQRRGIFYRYKFRLCGCFEWCMG